MSEAARELVPEESLVTEVPEKAEFSMRWHDFQLKYVLWVLMVLQLLRAAWILAGGIYYTGALARAIYTSLPAMRILDYALAGMLIVSALLVLLARKNLCAKKARGIHKLSAAYILLTLSMPLYLAARFLLTGLSPWRPAALGQSVGWVLLLVVHLCYYHRRRSIFSGGKELP